MSILYDMERLQYARYAAGASTCGEHMLKCQHLKNEHGMVW